MFRKSFLSLFFYKDKLYILQLSSDRKKVKKYLSVSVPDGIIVNNKVKDVNLLSKLLQTVWEKMDVKDKFVAISIPEYSAFTKLLKLPKVPISELHEAVLLQSQEFLPNEEENTVLDWKIINEEQGEYEILLVAVEKKLLFGYVNAIEKAGLFPLFVEIPSISLSRWVTGEESTIIVYGLDQSVIVVYSKNGKVVASSILHDQDPNEVTKTVKRISNHYKDIKIDAIKIGGYSGQQFEMVSKSLGDICTNVSAIDVNINGIQKEEIQNYLIPLSMQTIEPSEPADAFSINLLPNRLVTRYRNKRSRLRLWSLLLSITFFVWICLFSALGVFLYFGQAASNFEKQLAQSSLAKEREVAVKDSQEISSITSKVLAIHGATSSPVELLSLIERARPKGVAITDYKINIDRGQINLKGTSATRLSLIEFRQNLEKNEDVSNVQIPVSSFEVDTNLEFDIAFTYKTDSKTKK